MKKPKPIIKRCIVDGRFFAVYPRKKNGHHYHGSMGSYKKPHRAVTCSRRCSHLYLRHRKIYLKMRKP
jgi:hypothetical protein